MPLADFYNCTLKRVRETNSHKLPWSGFTTLTTIPKVTHYLNQNPGGRKKPKYNYKKREAEQKVAAQPLENPKVAQKA